MGQGVGRGESGVGSRGFKVQGQGWNLWGAQVFAFLASTMVEGVGRLEIGELGWAQVERDFSGSWQWSVGGRVGFGLRTRGTSIWLIAICARKRAGILGGGEQKFWPFLGGGGWREAPIQKTLLMPTRRNWTYPLFTPYFEAEQEQGPPARFLLIKPRS
jgi:hypothetical protein